MDWGDLVALIEDPLGWIESVGECKDEPFLEMVGGSAADDVDGLEGSKGTLTIDELAERNPDRFSEGLRQALRCGIGGAGLVLWFSSLCDVSEKLLLESGVAGGEGGRLRGSPWVSIRTFS